MSWKLKNHRGENTKEFDTRSEAEEAKSDMRALGVKPEDLEIIPPGEDMEATITDGGDTAIEPTSEPESEPMIERADVSQDPVDYMPGHFVDSIQGVPTINRKGYAVICAEYGVSVKAEPVTLPSDTDNEYAEFRAIATTKDGKEYSGFGSAHVDRKDGDDPYLLAELAETRAMKRAAAWATGVGMTAIEEMKNSL